MTGLLERLILYSATYINIKTWAEAREDMAGSSANQM